MMISASSRFVCLSAVPGGGGGYRLGGILFVKDGFGRKVCSFARRNPQP